jgi:hypothetical protein
MLALVVAVVNDSQHFKPLDVATTLRQSVATKRFAIRCETKVPSLV